MTAPARARSDPCPRALARCPGRRRPRRACLIARRLLGVDGHRPHPSRRPVELAGEAGHLGANRRPHRGGVRVLQVRAPESPGDVREDLPVGEGAARCAAPAGACSTAAQLLHPALDVRQRAVGLGERGRRQEHVDLEGRQVEVLGDHEVAVRPGGEGRLADEVEHLGSPPRPTSARPAPEIRRAGDRPAADRGAPPQAPRAPARRACWRRGPGARTWSPRARPGPRDRRRASPAPGQSKTRGPITTASAGARSTCRTAAASEPSATAPGAAAAAGSPPPSSERSSRPSTARLLARARPQPVVGHPRQVRLAGVDADQPRPATQGAPDLHADDREREARVEAGDDHRIGLAELSQRDGQREEARPQRRDRRAERRGPSSRCRSSPGPNGRGAGRRRGPRSSGRSRRA